MTKTTQFRYQTEPEFRAQHLKYMKTKVECKCGKFISRANLPRHRASKPHRFIIYGELPTEPEIAPKQEDDNTLSEIIIYF